MHFLPPFLLFQSTLVWFTAVALAKEEQACLSVVVWEGSSQSVRGSIVCHSPTLTVSSL